MAEPVRPRAATPVASVRVFLATFAAIIGVIIVLLGIDLALARVDRNETRQYAVHVYTEGQALLADGHTGDAVDRFATAVSLERTNLAYGLALAQAMLADRRTEDAEQTLHELLARAQNDGAVNLTMARLLDATGRRSDAKAYYHRAIYGRWGADSVQRRLRARFDLIDLLVRERAQEELLAELLPLQGTVADSTPILRRLAPLYLRAGSPVRAANLFRELLRRSPGDPAAYAGMGEAALALGRFQTAHADLALAAGKRPGDSTLAARLRLVDTVIALDPTARGLGETEQFARSRALLARTMAAIAACAGSNGALAAGGLADSARAELARPVPRGGRAGAAERSVLVASALWRARPARCPEPGARGGEALLLLHDAIAR